jgi:hypothetical protein
MHLCTTGFRLTSTCRPNVCIGSYLLWILEKLLDLAVLLHRNERNDLTEMS